MKKGKLIIAVGVVSVGICFSAMAQQIGDRGGAGFFGRSAAAPRMNLSHARAFPFGSSFAWMAPSNDFLPDWRPTGWDSSGGNLIAAWGQPVRTATTTGYSKDSSKEASDVRKSNVFDYVHGEVGGFFGTS